MNIRLKKEKSMMFHNDDDKEKELGAVSEEALGEVLEAEPEDDDAPAVPLEDDEKEWE